MSEIDQLLSAFPRTQLMSGPTPIEQLAQVSDLLGFDVFVKRDDQTGLGFGGNKIRQLEFYLGEAQNCSADTILITGAVQSNFVRAAAAAAAKLGMQSVLQLENRVLDMGPAYAQSGNVFLSQILGAKLIHYPDGEDEVGADAALHAHAATLRSQGRTPFVIPLGMANPPIGALGYMACAQELLAQMPEFDAVVLASGSGLTHIGLLAGLRLAGCDAPVFGSCVRRDRWLQTQRLNSVAQNLANLLGSQELLASHDILTWDGALAPGYGRLNEASVSAMRTAARLEGMFLDPVYTAKSFAALQGLLKAGKLEPGMKVVFLHTGGLPALFGYQELLTAI